jgi:hypothetical protein
MALRLRVLLPALWAGVMACIAAFAAPDVFRLLPRAEAGLVASRLFAQEAYLSLFLGIVLFLMERRVALQAAEAGQGSVFSVNLVLLLGTIFCTVAGYFALEPMMAAARAGQGNVPFAALHGVATGFFVLKGLLVLAFAWRVAGSPAAGQGLRPLTS